MNAEAKLERIRKLNADRQARWRARAADPNRADRISRKALRLLTEMFPGEYRDLVAVDRAEHPGPATEATYRRARRALRDAHRPEYAAARETVKMAEEQP